VVALMTWLEQTEGRMNNQLTRDLIKRRKHLKNFIPGSDGLKFFAA